MVYELRIYHCVPGRLQDLHKRFEGVTLKLWEKHGIRQVGFWTDMIGDSNNKLTYMLQWESLAERERKWQAFVLDPEWFSAKAETEKNGQLITRIENSILAPTAYSKLK
jgi:hypothetical protein